MTISPHHVLVTHAAYVVAAPLHVYVTNPPGPDVWVKITAGVAIATLLAVGYQILIGRKELKAVQDDLAQNKRLIDDAFRRPGLHASFTQTNGRAEAADGYRLMQLLHARIVNTGERPSTLVRLEVLVPSEFSISRTLLRIVGGHEYETVEFTVSPAGSKSIIFPNQAPLKAEGRFVHRLPAAADSFVCLWRLYDEYGSYPRPPDNHPDPRGYFGKIRSSAEWLQDGNPIVMEPVAD